MSQQVALTPKQAQYVSMTCQGQTNVDIAKELGVERKTITRWSKLPHIQAAITEVNVATSKGVAEQQQQQYKEIAKSASAQTTEIVERLLPAAVKTVAQILTNQQAKDSDRLKAAELLSKWGGLGQTANQPQQTGEQVLNLYLANLNANNNN